MSFSDPSKTPVVDLPEVAVASITATECQKWHFSPLYAALGLFFKAYEQHPFVSLPGTICDWISFTHVYPEQQPQFHDGRLIRVSSEGELVFDMVKGKSVKGSFDTSLYIRCDGDRLQFSGNVGRFGEPDNVHGYPFSQCWQKLIGVLQGLGISTEGLGVIHRTHNADGSVSTLGTRLTRVDVTCNCLVSDYALSCQAFAVCQIFGMQPERGKYGVKWGYDRKRGNWLRVKLSLIHI